MAVMDFRVESNVISLLKEFLRFVLYNKKTGF